MLKRVVFFLQFVSVVFSCELFAQNQIVTESIDSVNIKYFPEPMPNTLKPLIKTCGYYHFVPKDTILYTVHSFDSIAIDYGKPLLKSRHEIWQVICDSIGSINKNFYLNLSMVAFEAEERELGSKTFTHSNSDWLNRNTFIEIDSVGNRYSLAYDDSTDIGLNPGGAFQPFLFFNFQEACHDTGVSWTVLNKLECVVENGLPAPMLRSTYMLTNKGNKDTLGYKTNRIDFIKTAQGSITYNERNKNIRVTSIIATSGILDIGTELKIPIHFFQNMEQKLTIHTPDGVEKPGRHYITSYFQLLKYSEFKTPKAKKNKNNKNKKK